MQKKIEGSPRCAKQIRNLDILTCSPPLEMPTHALTHGLLLSRNRRRLRCRGLGRVQCAERILHRAERVHGLDEKNGVSPGTGEALGGPPRMAELETRDQTTRKRAVHVK